MRSILIIVALLVACGGPTPEVCTGGLAAKDLAGTCRATPQATLGALEVVE